jgi:hypothetical protein
MTADLHRAARWYARRGLHVFACVPAAKRPATPNGCHDATTDAAAIDAMWSRTVNANVGIAAGPSGLVVVDVDGGKSGWESLDAVQVQHGELPATPTVETASGAHFYFKAPAGIELGNSASKIGHGIDTRGAGGYVVAPPSVHPSGAKYRWEAGRGIHEIALAEVPRWIVDALAPREPERSTEPVQIEGARLTNYVRIALEKECAAVVLAPEGTRNDTLNRAAYSIGQLVGAGVCDDALARRSLIEAGRRSGLTLREVLATVQSGLSDGAKQPRRLAS